MGWNPLESPIDFFIMRHAISPGISSIEKASSPRKWDEIGGYGASGSVLIFHGRKLVPFDAVIRLYTPAHWEQWDTFKPIVMRPPYGKIPKAMDVWHPWLEAFEVKACVVTDVLQPEEIDNGGYKIVVQCLEHRRPRLTLAKPDAAEQKPADTDPADKLMNQLVGQIQELAK